MKSLSALFAILFLLMIGSVQAYDVNDPRYNPYAVPHKPLQLYQPYQPSYQSQGSYQVPRATPKTQAELMYESQMLRQMGKFNRCAAMGGNARAQAHCYNSPP